MRFNLIWRLAIFLCFNAEIKQFQSLSIFQPNVFDHGFEFQWKNNSKSFSEAIGLIWNRVTNLMSFRQQKNNKGAFLFRLTFSIKPKTHQRMVLTEAEIHSFLFLKDGADDRSLSAANKNKGFQWMTSCLLFLCKATKQALKLTWASWNGYVIT